MFLTKTEYAFVYSVLRSNHSADQVNQLIAEIEKKPEGSTICQVSSGLNLLTQKVWDNGYHVIYQLSNTLFVHEDNLYKADSIVDFLNSWTDYDSAELLASFDLDPQLDVLYIGGGHTSQNGTYQIWVKYCFKDNVKTQDGWLKDENQEIITYNSFTEACEAADRLENAQYDKDGTLRLYGNQLGSTDYQVVKIR